MLQGNLSVKSVLTAACARNVSAHRNFMKLDFQQALTRLPQATGLWVLHGDEPLLAQLLLDALRQHTQQTQAERQRFDLASPADWRNILDTFGNLSLFGGRQVVEAHGNAKPDAAALARLTQWLQDPGDNLLVVSMPKQDGAAQKSRFFQVAAANGTVVQLSINQPAQRRQILQQQAEHLGLALLPEAWTLLDQQTENHLLGAWQTLQRLATYIPVDAALPYPVNAALLSEGLLRQTQFTAFDLAEAALAGKPQRSVSILRQLLAAGEPPSLILWALNREMQVLLQLAERPHQAAAQLQQLGVWSSRQPPYLQALQRLDLTKMQTWPEHLLQIDRAIKGDVDLPVDLLLLRCTLALCGHELLPNAS